MSEHPAKAIRAYFGFTALLVAFGFALPAQLFFDLFLFWSVYTAVFSCAAALAFGPLKGCALPAASLAGLALVHPVAIPWCVATGIVSLIVGLCALLMRFGAGWLKQFFARNKRARRTGKRDVVTVVVPPRTTDISAADVLEQFGLGRGIEE